MEGLGEGVEEPAVGDRVGVPWLGGTDGTCPYCRHGDENLCERPPLRATCATGATRSMRPRAPSSCSRCPDGYPRPQAAPLLCAGVIGYRALRLTEIEELDGPPRLGLYGFGASAHIVTQLARHLGHDVYVCTRGERGAGVRASSWARDGRGAPDELRPCALDAAIIFAPAGVLVPAALRAVRPGGTVVCAGIHMSPIPEFPYELLWGERVLRSVANLTRTDGQEFMKLVPRLRIQTTVQEFALEDANEALVQLKSGALRGTAVLVP